MIIDFTTDEIQALDAIDKSYEKLFQENQDRMLKLRPVNPFNPDEEEYEAIQAKRLPEPVELKPQPIRIDQDGTPVYSKTEIDRYHATPEYRAYETSNKEANEAVNRQWEEWYSAGSPEWKAAKKRGEKLFDEHNESMTALYKEIEEKHFAALGSDAFGILENAKTQVDRFIPQHFQYYDNKREDGGSFSAFDVRVQKDGSFKLDTTETRGNLRKLVERHYQALKDSPDLIGELDQYIETALEKSPFVSDDGARFGRVPARKENETTLVARPQKYVTTVDKISGLLFKNELTKQLDDDPDESVAYDVVLREASKKTPAVIAKSYIDYVALLSNKEIEKIPDLNWFDYAVHDAIVSHIIAGNRIITVDMIYRAMNGKVDGKVNVSENIYENIKRSIAKFHGRLYINFDGKDPSGEPVSIHFNEPLVMYSWLEINIHGKKVAAIRIPYDADPVLLRWARLNGNELDSRDIALRNVPKLNNGDESAHLRDYLYRRIVSMKNGYDRAQRQHKPFRMSRKIKFETLYKELGITSPNKDKKLAIKKKVESCLSHFQKEKLIVSYTYTKKAGTKLVDGVEINFIHETTERKSPKG